ncbi:hypothetical protein CKG00_03675 [Morganella morganii]|uniref:Histidine phosphatase family protein n=1 Tax=Morganella morganii TaxID=582 RepID=A0A433ZU16_MORMO|nr:hypothetical protein [Morganella morganii]RUT65607.1 hypothetical protein CKG00_03675 [Morganella morganii]
MTQEILLIRHGEPVPDKKTPLALRDLRAWLAEYDAWGIILPSSPPLSLSAEELSRYFPVASPLFRTSASLAALGITPRVIIDELHEAELPLFSPALLMPVKLPPMWWVTAFRLLWLAGGGRSVPAVAQVRERAQSAAKILSGHAQEHGAVLVMAHRIINHALRPALEQSGWQLTEKTHNSYWGMMRFTRTASHR